MQERNDSYFQIFELEMTGCIEVGYSAGSRRTMMKMRIYYLPL